MRIDPWLFYSTPTQTIGTNSTPNTIPPYKKIIFSPLPLSPPISEPLSLTPQNSYNSMVSAYFQTQWPPWLFLFHLLTKPYVPIQLPTPSPHTKNHFSLLPLSPPISEPLSFTPQNSYDSYDMY